MCGAKGVVWFDLSRAQFCRFQKPLESEKLELVLFDESGTDSGVVIIKVEQPLNAVLVLRKPKL